MIRTFESAEYFLLLAASIVVWVYFLPKWIRSKQLPVKKAEEVALPPVGLVDLFVLLLLWIGGQLLGQVLVLANTELTMEAIRNRVATVDQKSMLMLGVKSAELAAMLIGMGYLYFRYRPFVRQLFCRHFVWHIGLGALAALMIIPPILGIHMLLSLLIPYEHATLESIHQRPGQFVLMTGWVTAVLIAPITEEFLCRAGIQSWIRRYRQQADFEQMNAFIQGGEPKNESNKKQQKPGTRAPFSPVFAILATAAFFAFLHYGQGLAFVPLFFLALGLGYIFERTKSIIPCLTIHFLLNAHSMGWETLKALFDQ